MKRFIAVLLITSTHTAMAQMCPGGGVNFNSAVTFDPAWIYGCNTGTSCNGGVSFDNRIACQPTTAMDACAPAPSCGTAGNNASNIWFKFYATATTATISCFQNTSLVIAVQAFNGGPACGTLTEIGCAIAGGPSSGVTLNLSGLVPGHLYYFRIFGSSNPVSQRTGLYCFCGTTGLSDFVLQVVLTSFKARETINGIELSWSSSSENNSQYFEAEHSNDGITYQTVSRIAAAGTAVADRKYSCMYVPNKGGTNYFRLKQTGMDGHYVYSSVVTIQSGNGNEFMISSVAGKNEWQLRVNHSDFITLYNLAGQLLQTYHVQAGLNYLSTVNLGGGIYLLRSRQLNQVRRIYLSN